MPAADGQPKNSNGHKTMAPTRVDYGARHRRQRKEGCRHAGHRGERLRAARAEALMMSPSKAWRVRSGSVRPAHPRGDVLLATFVVFELRKGSKVWAPHHSCCRHRRAPARTTDELERSMIRSRKNGPNLGDGSATCTCTPKPDEDSDLFPVILYPRHVPFCPVRRPVAGLRGNCGRRL